MTLEDMADALGVTQRAYWNYENIRVPFRRMTEIAQITGKTQDWLYRGDLRLTEQSPELLSDVAAGVAQLERSSEDALKALDECLVRLERIEETLSPGAESHQ